MSEAIAQQNTLHPQYIPAPGTSAGMSLLRGPFQLARIRDGCRIFFGDGHLLILRKTLEGAEARRIGYRDIRGITVETDRRSQNAAAAWVGMLGVAALMAAVALTPSVAAFALTWASIFGVIGVFGLLNNFRLGATCEVTLYTATTAESLDGLGRVVHAQAAVAELRRRIEAVQGTLPEDALLQPPEVFRAVDRPQPALGARREVPGFPPDNAAHSHLFFYGLLIVTTLSLLLDLVMHSDFKNTIDGLFFAAILLTGCYAAARQHSSELAPRLKSFTLFTLFMQAIFLYVVMVMVVPMTMALIGDLPPEEMFGQLEQMDFSDPDSAQLLPLLYVEIAWHGIPGIIGMLMTLYHRSRWQQITASRARDAATTQAGDETDA